MSMMIPCVNPGLCGVTMHHTGTDARCRALQPSTVQVAVGTAMSPATPKPTIDLESDDWVAAYHEAAEDGARRDLNTVLSELRRNIDGRRAGLAPSNDTWRGALRRLSFNGASNEYLVAAEAVNTAMDERYRKVYRARPAPLLDRRIEDAYESLSKRTSGEVVLIGVKRLVQGGADEPYADV